MKDSLENFVAIDIETTGTDPERDEIIELGAVRVRGGEIAERFGRLVSPTKPIPPVITHLTGISDGDCADQPPLSSILIDFCHFLGDDPIVVHNGPFDLGFLNRQLKSRGMADLMGEIFDTLTLSRIVLPRLKNHQLPTLLTYFRIPSPSAHRAGGDAENTARLFLALTEYVGRFDLDTLQTMARLTPPASPLHRLFSRTVRTAPLRKIGGRNEDRELLLDLFNVKGESRRKRKREPTTLDVETIEKTFGPEGELSRTLPHYEERPQQVKMAREVAQAFNNSQFLVVEAGTGVGKTLAYLIPAIHWALQSGERVIVSTKTKNLQEQLFYSDIPLLREATDKSFKAVLLKGRSGYLCLNKWYRTLAETDLSKEERSEILPLVTWLKGTVSGDISENTGFRLFQKSGLWNKVCAESTYCLGQRCKYKDRCFYQKVRAAAQGAHIVVTNHALLFSDALADHAVLDKYRCLVFDEAHTIEKVAAQHFGHDFTLWRVRSLINRLYLKEKVEVGLLVSLLRRVERAGLGTVQKGMLTKRLKSAIDRADRARAAATEFFVRLNQEAIRRAGGTRQRYRAKLRYGSSRPIVTVESSAELLGALKRLCGELSRIQTALSELPDGSFPAQAELTQDVSGRAQECKDLISDLSFLLKADDEGYVYWVELPSQEDRYDARLYAAPLEIGELMQSQFYKDLSTVIFTSATLTVGERFDYVLGRLGLDPETTAQLSVGSPFDFDGQALVCVPTFLPSPKESNFRREIGRLIEEVALATRRGTLALFTSHHMLTSAYADVKDPLEREGVLVLGQGMDGSRSRIMAQFKEEKSSVLMGTESFWEGVDLSGEALEVLFLAKLPFAVPTEPIVEAQMEALERRGLDPFQQYCLPEAVIKFRQGFGRLIRSREDRGVVLVCDTRVLTSSYGPLFLNSLPTKPLTCSDRETLLTEVKKWLSPKGEQRF